MTTMSAAPTLMLPLGVGRRTYDRFGTLAGTSVAMRSCFHLMERAATSDATVLLEGETGTGKSRAARAIHERSARADGPFRVVDCGAIPGNLLESELFGHEKGAFTGASQRRIGVFEEAEGGTVFLDEIGELPSELQPKLLRVLDDREIRRIGANTYAKVNVRIIAATHRDLRAEVNAARFRSDLFFRLAVLRIGLPALRERPEDIAAMVEPLLSQMGASSEHIARFSTPELLTRLQQCAWPGNVRELRNYLERCLLFEEEAPIPVDDEPMPGPPSSEGATAHCCVRQPYAEARQAALEQFERDYVAQLLERHAGQVTQAASAAQMDRVYLHRLIRRHGLKPARPVGG
jgi:DNA-binding NtrC family response regulator